MGLPESICTLGLQSLLLGRVLGCSAGSGQYTWAAVFITSL
jgi:hypothetical protein